MASPNRQHNLNDRRAAEVDLLLSADLEIRFLNFNRRHTWHLEDGMILMRRQTTRTPMEAHAPVVGWASRVEDNETVSTHSGVAWGTNAIWFVRPQRIGRGGVPARTPTQLIRTVVFASGSYVGAIPETPCHVTARPVVGGKILLTWIYNPIGEQAAPATFEVFHDNGTGTIIGTKIGTVDYRKGQYRYVYLTAAYAAGTKVSFTVRAKTTDSVYSLFPDALASNGGYTGSYSAVPVTNCAKATTANVTLAAPTEVGFS